MWIPKNKYFVEKANNIAEDYERYIINGGLNHTQIAERIADKYGMSTVSVYRYLKVAGVKIKERKRDMYGRFS